MSAALIYNNSIRRSFAPMEEDQHALLSITSHGSPSSNDNTGFHELDVHPPTVTLNTRICSPNSDLPTAASAHFIKQVIPTLTNEDNDLNKLVKFISSQDMRTFKQIASIKDSSMINLERGMVPQFTTQGIFDHFCCLRDRLRELHGIVDGSPRTGPQSISRERSVSNNVRLGQGDDKVDVDPHRQTQSESIQQDTMSSNQQSNNFTGNSNEQTDPRLSQPHLQLSRIQQSHAMQQQQHQSIQLRSFESITSGILGNHGPSRSDRSNSQEAHVGSLELNIIPRPKLKRKARETFESDLQKIRRQEGHTLAANPDANKRRRCIVCCQRCTGGHKHHTRHGTPTRYGCRECMLALLNRRYDDSSYFLAQQASGYPLLLPLCNSARFPGDPRTCFEIHHSDELSYPNLQCRSAIEDGDVTSHEH